MPTPASIPLPSGENFPRESGQQDLILNEKAGQARGFHPLAGQDSEKMKASGWQTAAPQKHYFEEVTVTDSACQQLLEGITGISDDLRSIDPAIVRVRAGELYAAPRRSLEGRRIEFHPFAHPVRTAVSWIRV